MRVAVLKSSPFGFSDSELVELKEKCLSGVERRKDLYSEYRKWVFDNTRKNSLSKYLNDIVSLIYLPDNIIFDIKAPQEVRLRSHQLEKMQHLSNSLQERFISDALDISFYEWFYNACLYGCYFIKCIDDGGKISFNGVNPSDIHVLYEDRQELDRHQVIVHTSRQPIRFVRSKYPDARLTEVSADKLTATTADERFLSLVSSANEVRGNLQYPLRGSDIFSPKQVGGYVEIHEMWIYSEKIDDYVMVQFVGDKIYKSRNPFLPKMHPFIRVCLNEVEGYFWGMSEIYYLLNLHQRLDKELNLIEHVETMLAKPPMIVYGLSGSIEADEIQEKLKVPNSVIQIIDPTSKFEFFLPKLDIGLLYNSVRYIEDSIKEQSGISGVIAGKPMPNVRSASYANILAQFASTVLKKKALIAEYVIETVMTMYADALIYSNPYYKELLGIPIRVDVFAHTSSPITSLSYQDMLLTLAEAGMLPPEIVVDLLPLPRKEKIKQYMQTKAIANETTQEQKKE